MKPTTLALILAGGRVDELGVLTYQRPKSAVPFGGLGRIIDFSLSNLMQSKIWHVSILSQYRSFSLINHVGTGAAWDMLGRERQVLVMPPYLGANDEGWYRGPADAIFKNLDYVTYTDPEEVLILSGDHIYHMDYQPMLEYHRRKNADFTLAFTKVPKEHASRFGIGKLDDEDGSVGGRLLNFWEKAENPDSDWASMTVMVFKPNVLYELLKESQEKGEYHFGRDIFPAALQHNLRVYGYKFSGYWGYTRTVDEYWRSNMDLLGDTPLIDLEKWNFRTNLNNHHISDKGPMLVSDTGTVKNSMVYNGSEIYGTVRNSIIFPGVIVQKDAVVENSVIFFDNIIGENCHLNKVVSDENNIYGCGAVVGSDAGAVTLVGRGNTLPQMVEIGAGAIVEPELLQNHWKMSLAAGEVLR